MSDNPTVSICVPTFELGGRGISMLTTLFMSVEPQTYKDFEIVISDHSLDDSILNLCTEWDKRLPISYIKNHKSRGSCEANLNNAIRHARGKFIKPLLQDDFFHIPEALQLLVDALPTDRSWSAGGCLHCNEDNINQLFRFHTPTWIPDDSLALGHNRIGSPSVVLYPKDVKNLFFDENLLLFMDCELYYRLGREIGPPICIPAPIHIIRFRHDSISDSQVTDAIRDEEYRYVVDKIRTFERPLSDFPIMFERAQRLKLQQPFRYGN